MAIRNTHHSSRLVGLILTTAAALTVALAGLAPTANAGVQHNNTDPYSTGCNNGASLPQPLRIRHRTQISLQCRL